VDLSSGRTLPPFPTPTRPTIYHPIFRLGDLWELRKVIPSSLMALRVAKATDQLAEVEHERLLARVATPAAKFFNCSRAPSIAYEALQCHGGNGFIEENPVAQVRSGPFGGCPQAYHLGPQGAWCWADNVG
jgi:hypothetical protein